MEQEIIKKIVLKPIKVIRQSANNPYMRGLVTKRDLTIREACHIYREIYLFNLDISLDDFIDSKEERDDFYQNITETMNDYIKGNCSFDDLCEATYCYDDGEGGTSIASQLKLVEYLQKKGVI